MGVNLLPDLTDESRAVLEDAAKQPELVWKIQSDRMPDLMKQVDVMLRAGASPEWIMNRGDFFYLPVEAQTAFLNALHWRQNYLRQR